jgi:hypothetical protein
MITERPENTAVLHPVRRSPRLNPFLHIRPNDAYFSYRGVNYKRIYRLVHYRGRCYAVPEVRVLEGHPERDSDSDYSLDSDSD